MAERPEHEVRPERFQTAGAPWSERAASGELRAVLSLDGTERRNRFLNAVHSFGAAHAAALAPRGASVVDFGCGTGRFLRFFGERRFSVLGTEITSEMLVEARRLGLPAGARVELTDGIHIPAPDASVDLVWVCAVLRYSLLIPEPVYAVIAREMFRVLKPGGHVVNVEMYVDQPPGLFTRDFESAGFVTDDIRVLMCHEALLERLLQSRFMPLSGVALAGAWTARHRFARANPHAVQGLRDYLFTWRKPAP